MDIPVTISCSKCGCGTRNFKMPIPENITKIGAIWYYVTDKIRDRCPKCNGAMKIINFSE